MNIDDIGQNLNTRVVFKEPRGMMRWLQLLFALISVLVVANFDTRIGVDISCLVTVNQTEKNYTSSQILNVTYPFEFSDQELKSPCPNSTLKYQHLFSLTGSPQFFVMTGSLSIIFVFATLVMYLLFSSLYHSMPLIPVIDLIITGLLGIFWFTSSITFGFGVYLLKNTATYEVISQLICQPHPEAQNATVTCMPSSEQASWSSLDVALLSGFTSFFLWVAGIWFVFKETHFHTPREQFGPN